MGPLKSLGPPGKYPLFPPLLGGPACARGSSHARALDWFLVSACGKFEGLRITVV